MDGNRVAFPVELAMIDRVDAGDALRQDRLPRTVVPGESGDLSRVEVQVHVGESLHGAEVLVDAAHFEQRLSGGGQVLAYLSHALTLARGEKKAPPHIAAAPIAI
jgi:hypothetical protein